MHSKKLLTLSAVAGLAVGCGIPPEEAETEAPAMDSDAAAPEGEYVSQEQGLSTRLGWRKVCWPTAGLYTSSCINSGGYSWGTVYAGDMVYIDGFGGCSDNSYVWGYARGFGRQAHIRADALCD